MLPGPVIVNKCPCCHGLVKQSSIASGNTFGAERWTDGEIKARMMPNTPLLIKCSHCQKVSWHTDFSESDRFENYFGFLALSDEEKDLKLIAEAKSKQLKYELLPFYEDPSSLEIIHFVTSSQVTREQELFARLVAWRKWNDSRRQAEFLIPLSLHEQVNLEQVIKILAPSTDEKLLLAEAYRELGQLEKAKSNLLQNTFSYDEESTVQFLLELIEIGETQVCLITEDEEREWRMLRRVENRTNPKPSLPQYDSSGPKEFLINSRDWWFKPVDMLVHNWALIESSCNKTATVYFFHDNGSTKSGSQNYKLFQLKGRCAIIDSLEFENQDAAKLALGYNGFRQLETNAGPWDGNVPLGNFYDARATEEGVYSKAGYWKSHYEL